MVVECSSVFLWKFTHPLQEIVFKNNFENFTILITPNPDNIRKHLVQFFFQFYVFTSIQNHVFSFFCKRVEILCGSSVLSSTCKTSETGL